MSDNQQYRRMIRRVVWTGALLGVAALVISAIEQKQSSAIVTTAITIEPLEDSTLLIQQGDVMLALDRSFDDRFNELALKSVNVDRIEQVLEREPFIKDADVYITAANFLKIKVTQREPILRVIDKNGLNYYLDGQGYKMPLSKHVTAKVVVATGNIPPHVPNFLERKRHVLKDLFHLTQFIISDPFYLSLIEQVHVTNSGDFVFIPLLGDQKIIFGKIDRMEEKFRNLKAFYDRAIPVNGWRKYKTINLKYKGQIVCE